jgi:hypothetical protein
MVAPIVVQGELVGVLCTSSRRYDARYDDNDFKAFQVFAQNVGTCIRHAQEVDGLQRTLVSMDIQLNEKMALLRRYERPAAAGAETAPEKQSHGGSWARPATGLEARAVVEPAAEPELEAMPH